MLSRVQAIDDVFKQVQNLCGPDISIEETGIFEDTLIKAAGIHSENATGTWGVNELTLQLSFQLNGVTAGEAARFKAFLTATLNDEDLSLVQESVDSYSLPISIEQVQSKLIPLFETELKKIDQAKLDEYRLKSQNADSVLLNRLNVLFNEMQRLSTELQSSAIAEYVKGQLNIIIDKIFMSGVTDYHNHHKGHGCGEAQTAILQSKIGLEMYKELLDSNEVLAANETAKELEDDAGEYLVKAEKVGDNQARKMAEARQAEQARLQSFLQQMGMFSQQSRQPNVVPDLSNLNPYASESSDEESEELGLMDRLRSAFGMRK